MKNTANCSPENSRYEVRFAGSGGQGIILAGIILAEAAVMDGKYVVQTQSYGAEARGGNSVSEVVLSNEEIDYPEALALDLLVALTQEACDRNLPDMRPGGRVIADSNLVRRVLWPNLVSLPFKQIASKVGEERAINIAALGAVAAFCPHVSTGSLSKVIAKRLPAGKVEANLQAFDEAFILAGKRQKSPRSVRAGEEFEI